MTRIRYRKVQAPGTEWPKEGDWPIYDVEFQDHPRGRWRHVGRVARYGERDWAALGDGAHAWTSYHHTRQAAVTDMLAGRTFLDEQREHPSTDTGHVTDRSAGSDGDGGAAGRIYERDGEVFRALGYQSRGGQALARADYVVRRDSDARYGGFIADTTKDGGQPPGDGYCFEVYDDCGRYLARTRSFRGALMVLAMPRRTRWISEHLPPDFGRAKMGPVEGPGADAAWKDAYYVARAGATNPAGVRRAIARHEAVLGARHPAVEAMCRYLRSLEGTGPGPDAALLGQMDAHAQRLGLRPSGEPSAAGGGEPGAAASGRAPYGELTGDSPYRAALGALDSFGDVARGHEQAAEALEAQLTVHGFDRHQALMAHVTALRQLAGQARTDAGRARQVLAERHATGDDYHTSGADAGASGFRNTRDSSRRNGSRP
ncbi:MAG: hypothetical protein J2P30_20580 [Actinobacteria bacterium]|nr:hypothetical protein [Actinomycetota bacterium]